MVIFKRSLGRNPSKHRIKIQTTSKINATTRILKFAVIILYYVFLQTRKLHDPWNHRHGNHHHHYHGNHPNHTMIFIRTITLRDTHLLIVQMNPPNNLTKDLKILKKVHSMWQQTFSKRFDHGHSVPKPFDSFRLVSTPYCNKLA